jgi:SAM-dependent methyltransferase
MEMKKFNKKTFYDEDYFEGSNKAQRPSYTRDLVYSYFLSIASMLKKILSPKKVLDLGCAKGFLVEAFMDLGIDDVWGIDISKYAIYNSPKEIRHRLIIGDIEESLPFENQTFDLITAIDLFEHLQYPSNVLLEAQRILKKNGKMFAVICGEGSPNATKDLSHINIQSYDIWKDIIEKNGFSILQYRDVGKDYGILMERK